MLVDLARFIAALSRAEPTLSMANALHEHEGFEAAASETMARATALAGEVLRDATEALAAMPDGDADTREGKAAAVRKAAVVERVAHARALCAQLGIVAAS